jgi:hypothetical protein
MVSKPSEHFPLPESPVKMVSCRRGMSSDTYQLFAKKIMSATRRQFLQHTTGLWLSTALSHDAAFGSAQERTINCRVVDAPTQREVAVRIRLLDATGREIVPLGHPPTLSDKAQEGDVRFQRRRFAYVAGKFKLAAAELPIKYQIIKGYEYRIAEGEIRAADSKDGVVTIPLER